MSRIFFDDYSFLHHNFFITKIFIGNNVKKIREFRSEKDDLLLSSAFFRGRV